MKIFIFIILISVGLISCKKVLDEKPKSQVTEENFFGPSTTESAIEQYINGIYPANYWAIYDRRWYWFSVVPADEFDHTVQYDSEGQEYDRHDFNAGQFNIYRQWNYIWWPIARANTFLAHYDELDANFGNTWTKLKSFKGQALFFRAYNYFIGLQMWGEIPLVTTAPNGENFGNSTLPALYTQVIADLEEIVTNNYLPAYTAYPEADKGRISIGAVKSLLAKVYLTKAYSPASDAGDIVKAVSYSKDVVENGGYSLLTQPVLGGAGDTLHTAYQTVFLPEFENGPEGIWEYQFLSNTGRSNINEEWVPFGYYGEWGIARFETTSLLYSSFEPGDQRKKSHIIGEVVSPISGETINTAGKIYMTKFRDTDPAHSSYGFSNNYPYIRFADILLIYAEALNKQGDGPTPAAFDAINRVRNRAGLLNLSGNYDSDSFLKAIQDERFKELAGEGHRLMDLRRWGFATLKERVELSNPNASVEPHEVLYPIPSYELGYNNVIKQNPGY